jgi:hypothetical protein
LVVAALVGCGSDGGAVQQQLGYGIIIHGGSKVLQIEQILFLIFENITWQI